MIVFHLKDTSARIHSSLRTIIMYTLHIRKCWPTSADFLR